jgi:hypothetical protein
MYHTRYGTVHTLAETEALGMEFGNLNLHHQLHPAQRSVCRLKGQYNCQLVAFYLTAFIFNRPKQFEVTIQGSLSMHQVSRDIRPVMFFPPIVWYYLRRPLTSFRTRIHIISLSQKLCDIHMTWSRCFMDCRHPFISSACNASNCLSQSLYKSIQVPITGCILRMVRTWRLSSGFRHFTFSEGMTPSYSPSHNFCPLILSSEIYILLKLSVCTFFKLEIWFEINWNVGGISIFPSMVHVTVFEELSFRRQCIHPLLEVKISESL